jgi:hypothetical protein
MDAWGIEWLILVLWLGLIFIGELKDKIFFKGAGSIIGIFLGLTLTVENAVYGFILVILNIGVLFYTLFFN